MKRNGRRLDRQADQYRRQHQPPSQWVAVQRCRGGQLRHVECVWIGCDVQTDEIDQQRQRTKKGVEEELHRRSTGIAVAPAGNDEVHRHDRQVEEEKEQDQIGRDDQPEADRLQEKE